ncbi:MAG: hypothetical protein WDZ39_01870 [Candidatus Spechtbacterales bacterium]
MKKRVLKPIKNPPKKGDFVKDSKGNTRRVKKIEEKGDSHDIEYEDGEKERWKCDDIVVISRDEGWEEDSSGELRMRYEL